MMAKLSSLFVTFSRVAASSQKLGINLIRVAILVIFMWIGGLKFWNYEAEGIVPFVANSPFMSFFYTKSTPEYLDLLGYFLFQDWFDRCRAGYYHDVRYSLVSRDYSRSMGSRFGKR